ncbi:MAG: hypothetical protein WBB32_02025 [Flavobacteriales bacterium]
MRIQLIVLFVIASTTVLSQNSLPYRDAATIEDKTKVTGLFISFESLSVTEQRVLDLTAFSGLNAIDFYAGVPNDVLLDSSQSAGITRLSLNNCGLLEMPSWMMRSDALRFVRLSSLSVRVNNLKQLPICGLDDLVVLDVSFNPEINVICLQSTTSLTELLADGSGLDWSQFPVGLTNLSMRLHKGRISRNELACLSPLTGLRSLDLSTNSISGKHLLEYIQRSCIDTLYLYNALLTKRQLRALSNERRRVVFPDRSPRKDAANPINPGSTIWRPLY